MTWLRSTGLACLLLAGLVVACGGGESAPTDGSNVASPSATQVPGTATETATGPLPSVRLERAFPSLSFSQMTGLYQAADGRWFVTQQRGRILVFDNRADVTQASVFLDITDRVDASSSEMGLLGLALAPDFAQSGVFYLDYTAANPRRTVISRFVAPGSHATADKASEQVLLEVAQPFTNHKGGQTAFGPDGYLYVGFGDGGSARDLMGNGQNLGVLLAKIIRIDVSGSSGSLAYRIPADNPFGDRAGARPEIWAFGVRNPWRFSFDAQTGALWLGDVGQNAREEVDLITKGGNYGWNVMEGNSCLSGSTCNRDGLILPVTDYPTEQPNCSVTGGFVYRGRAIEALRGAYVYSDYCSGNLWALRYDGSRVTEQRQITAGRFNTSSFAQGTDGELYLLQYGQSSGIFKLVP